MKLVILGLPLLALCLTGCVDPGQKFRKTGEVMKHKVYEVNEDYDEFLDEQLYGDQKPAPRLVEEPTFCYSTLAAVDCYTHPLQGQQHRLISIVTPEQGAIQGAPMIDYLESMGTAYMPEGNTAVRHPVVSGIRVNIDRDASGNVIVTPMQGRGTGHAPAPAATESGDGPVELMPRGYAR